MVVSFINVYLILSRVEKTPTTVTCLLLRYDVKTLLSRCGGVDGLMHGHKLRFDSSDGCFL